MDRAEQAAAVRATLPAGGNRIWEAVTCFSREWRCPRGRFLPMDAGARRDFYYLAEGRLAILHCAPNGRVRNMLTVEDGNLFNTASGPGNARLPHRRSGTQFYCLEAARVRRFSSDLLRDAAFIREHPALIANVLETMSVRLLIMHDMLSGVGTADTAARVARFALEMSGAHGGAREFRPGLSQAALAELFGVHRVTLLRALAGLKRSGALTTFTRERLAIGDMEQLRRLAGV